MNMIEKQRIIATYDKPDSEKELSIIAKEIVSNFVCENDKLIGFTGDPKIGKSIMVEAMFPEVSLVNDDENINIRPFPLIEDYKRDNFRQETYHMDVMFEAAFNSKHKLGQAAKSALKANKRIIIEHFDKIYHVIKINAHLNISMGEKIKVIRSKIES
ncbi:hypothetical protein [Natranaerofaba carboxydovora]|uniref:hypothetical protein n=1 Tax=Natranaerofaba carboxydovora TaxID=2742683 RepID=UPI001F132EC6|nr:hypothetical protein [Natranaerofaba carboxydovora]UMZ72826.1 hypothetical protein ACONDI_00356 [Natranaerofaba carboxydovora]